MDLRQKIIRMHTERIRKSGMSVVVTPSPFARTSMVYTIGLSAGVGYELICFGMEMHRVAAIFSGIRESIIDGYPPELDTLYDIWHGILVKFKKCDPVAHPELWTDCTCHVELVLNKRPDIWQMVYADNDDRWPEDPHYDRDIKRMQYLLY